MDISKLISNSVSSDNKIKLYYSDIVKIPGITSVLDPVFLSKVYNNKYFYLNELDFETQYQVSVKILRYQKVIYFNFDEGCDYVAYSQFNIDENYQNDMKLSEISEQEIIDNLIKFNNLYNINKVPVVYSADGSSVSKYPSIFMDIKNIINWQSDIHEFILNCFKIFLMTPRGTVTFNPEFGTKIKEYLHKLTINQIKEMVEYELNNYALDLFNYLKQYDENVNIKINTEVKIVTDGITNSIKNLEINIYINNVKYTINIR